MTDLDAFLAAHAALPWAWGAVDSGLAMADWVVANGHGDPLALYRGAYGDEAGWSAVMIRRGGLLPIVSDGAARAGLMAVPNAVRGAVGVLGLWTQPARQEAALHDGAQWLVRTPGGFEPSALRPLGLWGV